MNTVLSTIEKRFSCRSYTGAPLSKENAEQIAKAAMQAPSALNAQKWHVVMVNNKAMVDEMSAYALSIMKAMPDQSTYNRIMDRGGNPFYNAPAIALVLKQVDSGKNVDIDCGILVQNMALAAASLGINSVIAAMVGMVFTGDRADEFKTKLNVPAGYEFGISLIMGEGNMEKAPHDIDMDKVTFI